MRHVELADHLAAPARRAKRRIDALVVPVEVGAELVSVRPVELPVRREVVLRVARERSRLVSVRKEQQPLPVLRGELRDLRWRLRARHGLVAREDALGQELARCGIDVELEIAVGEP